MDLKAAAELVIQFANREAEVVAEKIACEYNSELKARYQEDLDQFYVARLAIADQFGLVDNPAEAERSATWRVVREPHHVEADKDHKPEPDEGGYNCRVCGLAITSDGQHHGWGDE